MTTVSQPFDEEDAREAVDGQVDAQDSDTVDDTEAADLAAASDLADHENAGNPHSNSASQSDLRHIEAVRSDTGDTEQTHTFTEAFGSAPIVTATPHDDVGALACQVVSKSTTSVDTLATDSGSSVTVAREVIATEGT